MKNLFCILALSIIIVACQNETKSSKTVIEPKKMAAILIDIHLLESQIPHLSRMPDSSYLLYKAYEKKIFQKHQIDSSSYQQSYRYYLNNLQVFEKIYVQVIDSLVYRESTLNLGKPIIKEKKKDSSTIIKKDSLKVDRKRIIEKMKQENLKLNS